MAEHDHLTLALALGDWPQAERLLMRLAHAPDPQPAVLYNLGRVMMEQEKWPDARVWLQRCLERAPDHANACFELGLTELELEDMEAAGRAFARVLEISPEDLDARRNLGRIALRLGHYTQVRAVLAPLAGQDAEIAGMLYRAAAELRLPEAAEEARTLWQTDRVTALYAITRASKGQLPLGL